MEDNRTDGTLTLLATQGSCTQTFEISALPHALAGLRAARIDYTIWLGPDEVHALVTDRGVVVRLVPARPEGSTEIVLQEQSA